MIGDQSSVPGGRRRMSTRSIAVLTIIAFVGGIAATVLIVRQFRDWLPTGAQAMLDPAQEPGTAGTGHTFMPPPEQGGVAQTFDREMLGARQDALAAQLTSLEARSAAITSTADAAAGNAGRAERLLIAFAARRAIDRGLPLGPVEPELQRVFGASLPRPVAAIIKAGRTPVTLEELRLQLDAIAPTLMTGAATDGWWASFRRELGNLIVIRREGTPSPRPAERLARVRRLIDAQKVEAALVEEMRLPGADRSADWQASARRYIDVHQALDLIESSVLMNPVAPSPVVAPGKSAIPSPGTGQQ